MHENTGFPVILCRFFLCPSGPSSIWRSLAPPRDYWDPREFPDEGRWLHPRSGLWHMRHCTVLWFLKASASPCGRRTKRCDP